MLLVTTKTPLCHLRAPSTPNSYSKPPVGGGLTNDIKQKIFFDFGIHLVLLLLCPIATESKVRFFFPFELKSFSNLAQISAFFFPLNTPYLWVLCL